MPDRRVRYCPYCATELVIQDEHGIARPTCPACGFIYYRNPVPAAGVLLEWQGGLLMVRRKFEPRAGTWCLPAGFMEFGETPEACAVRELEEETGIHGRLTGLFGVYTSTDDPRTRAVLIVYGAEREGGSLTPGDDAIEAEFFPLVSLPEPIAFHSHTLALEDYRAQGNGSRAPGGIRPPGRRSPR
jgi:8-oxo-dGTP diphosphatase